MPRTMISSTGALCAAADMLAVAPSASAIPAASGVFEKDGFRMLEPPSPQY